MSPFSLSQIILSLKYEPKYVIPYINRIGRYGGEPFKIIKDAKIVIKDNDIETKILSASFRSSKEIEEAIVNGSDAITIPSNIFEEILENPLSKKAIEDSSDIFINMMKPMMGMVVGLFVLIFGIVMYLMIKVMIDRSAQNIALMKVFGYRKKEIKKLYLDGNFYMIVIGALISVPLSKKLMDAMYPAMVSNIACGMNLSFSWQLYAMIYAGIIITYLVINKLLVRKIYKVGPSDALKNRE